MFCASLRPELRGASCVEQGELVIREVLVPSMYIFVRGLVHPFVFVFSLLRNRAHGEGELVASRPGEDRCERRCVDEVCALVWGECRCGLFLSAGSDERFRLKPSWPIDCRGKRPEAEGLWLTGAVACREPPILPAGDCEQRAGVSVHCGADGGQCGGAPCLRVGRLARERGSGSAGVRLCPSYALGIPGC